MKYAPRRSKRSSSGSDHTDQSYVSPSSVSHIASLPWTVLTMKSSHAGR